MGWLTRAHFAVGFIENIAMPAPCRKTLSSGNFMLVTSIKICKWKEVHITICKINGGLEEFNFAHPCTKYAVMQKYCTCFNGYELWGLYSSEFNSFLAYLVLMKTLYRGYSWPCYYFDSYRSESDSNMALLFWDNPQAVAYSAQSLCWSGWEIPSPTIHRGAVRKDGAEIPWGWSLPECFTSSVVFNIPLYFK